eukprot:1637844-Rhodomonas_salina.3
MFYPGNANEIAPQTERKRQKSKTVLSCLFWIESVKYWLARVGSPGCIFAGAETHVYRGYKSLSNNPVSNVFYMGGCHRLSGIPTRIPGG